MKNPAPYVRKALYTLLDGAVTYEGDPVPVYEGEGEHGPTYQIVIAEQTTADKDTKHNFGHTFTQLIEVQAEQATWVRKHVDAIGNSVTDLIRPTPRTTWVVIDPLFQVLSMRLQSINYLHDESGSGKKIQRLLLRYSFTIIEA